ncbi:DUF383-domain-containing protein [Exidia glandulosa HHB12029]|uniref:Protein HGH1 homolog n=1 Tax=Exidia glandulosa HHB12029 TaxID=1314781 RepID=A0A165H5K4_EXIGL|nr:DUF383-domain-containing protein [Exidia glandulosa HHB12029]
MESQLRELLPFLHDRNPNVRLIALQNLLGHTEQGAAHRSIFFSDATVQRDLKILCRDQAAVAHDAFRALVNLSDAPQLANTLGERDFLAFLCSYIIHPSSVLADLAAMVLSNLSAFPKPCATLLTLEIPIVHDDALKPPYYAPYSRSGTSIAPDTLASLETVNTRALPLLLDAFVDAAKVEGAERTRKGDLHFLASVFANLSAPRRPTGNPLEYPLAKLVAYTEHTDMIRRGGVISTLKNCAFHAPAHRAMLSPESERVAGAPGIDALPYLLLPLAGPEEFDLDDQEKMPSALQFLPSTKTREADPALRLMLVESLLLLCTKRWGREFLRAHGVYEVIKVAHLAETDDNIAEHIERLVNLLKRDEPPGVQEADEEDVLEGTKDDEIEEV